MNESFRNRLRNGDLLLGAILTLPSPEIAELLSQAGFDWLFVDMEHTSLDVKDVQRILQAVGKEFPCLVRIPVLDEAWIKKVLESGPAGILVPHVNTPEDAEKVLRWSKYPPEGTRSAGISRAQDYGLNLQDYMIKANQTLVILPQVEHIEAVENLESFVKIPGLSAIFVGPYDLSGSIGKLGRVSDPEIQGLVQKVHAICSKAGVVTGIFGMDAEAVKSYIDIGYSLVAVGTDTSYLAKSAQDTLRSLRK
ncbi:MAG: 2,4-dihydroxyhept-2-ene-1,7-dioic acid aldolase [Candidatus Aminicenantes bacterium]|nr:MAG: 2,4-dihydroxyhept-2-ene-1,7-dioic acid aldolase [Candidatus Aminicenantes bacterium]